MISEFLRLFFLVLCSFVAGMFFDRIIIKSSKKDDEP